MRCSGVAMCVAESASSLPDTAGLISATGVTVARCQELNKEGSVGEMMKNSIISRRKGIF